MTKLYKLQENQMETASRKAKYKIEKFQTSGLTNTRNDKKERPTLGNETEKCKNTIVKLMDNL